MRPEKTESTFLDQSESDWARLLFHFWLLLSLYFSEKTCLLWHAYSRYDEL